MSEYAALATFLTKKKDVVEKYLLTIRWKSGALDIFEVSEAVSSQINRLVDDDKWFGKRYKIPILPVGTVAISTTGIDSTTLSKKIEKENPLENDEVYDDPLN